MNFPIAYWILCSLLVFAGLTYLIMMIAFNKGFNKLRRRREHEYSGSLSVFISVVIAARNEEKNIGHCLDDLALQDYPKDMFEVTVVDDHSCDNTIKVVEKFAETNPAFPLKLVKLSAFAEGKKNAIETAIHSSRGELFLTIDADCRTGSGLLRTYASCFNSTHAKMIIGPVTFFEGTSAFTQMQTLEFLSLIASGAGMAGLGVPVLANSANLAFSRDAFVEAGGYSSNKHLASGDDVFLLQSIKRIFGNESIKFLYDTKALVHTYPQSTIKAFFDQRMRWVSKAKAYRDWQLTMISVVVFLFSIVLIAGFAASAFHWIFAAIATLLFVLKCISDLPLLLRITAFTDQRKIMRYFLPLQVIYPFYVVITAVSGLFGRFSWKGRDYSG